MRSKKDLKNFGHATKTKEEKTGYLDAISSTTRETSLSQEDSFEETINDTELAGKPEKIKPPKPPRKSWRTFFEEHGRTILITAIGIPVIGWIATTFINYGNDISAINANYTNLSNTVTEIKNKYDSVNEKTIRAEELLKQVRKDIDYLESKVNQAAKQ